MSWMMPEAWADDFDPPMAEWRVATAGEMLTAFPGVADRGWGSNPMMVQRDFWVRFTPPCPHSPAKTETLVVEWARPWQEVIAIIRDGVVIMDMPESKEEFDTFWKTRMAV